MAHSYKDLQVWQKAKRLAGTAYRATAIFPKTENYGLTAQIRRAAVSVVSNIAEGQGRLTKGEFLNSLGQSRGSLLELMTQHEIALDLSYMNNDSFAVLDSQCNEVLRMINGLIDSLQRKAKAASGGTS